MNWQRILFATLVMAGFAVLGTALVTFVHQRTQPRIARQQHQALLRKLHAIMPKARYDNAILNTRQTLAPLIPGSKRPVTVYLACQAQRPVAAVFDVSTPYGYGGPIQLLVGVDYSRESVLGVRVLSEHETPGLGDAIERTRSDWITHFKGRSLGQPPLAQWKVNADGGRFDQFTGATITPRAVVGAVRRTLVYFHRHKRGLFRGAPGNLPNGPADTKPDCR